MTTNKRIEKAAGAESELVPNITMSLVEHAAFATLLGLAPLRYFSNE